MVILYDVRQGTLLTARQVLRRSGYMCFPDLVVRDIY
jgi:hypothetical protein